MRIHGDPDTWEGNVVFNDQHVEYFSRPDPEQLRWSFMDIDGGPERQYFDNLFHAEHDQNRSLIDEQIELMTDHDGRGTVHATGKKGGAGALDQRNNYLRPISSVEPGVGGEITAKVWID